MWDNFMGWFREIFEIGFPLGCLDVIFGIVNENDEMILHALNFGILHGKQFIRKQKLRIKTNLSH